MAAPRLSSVAQNNTQIFNAWSASVLYTITLGKPQNSNSGGQKTSIFIDNVPFTLHPLTRLIDTNTNAKIQQMCPSISF